MVAFKVGADGGDVKYDRAVMNCSGGVSTYHSGDGLSHRIRPPSSQVLGKWGEGWERE